MSFASYSRDGAVGTVLLNRPERLNAISGALLGDLIAALEEAIRDPEAHVLILTGAGRAFCSGDDLKEFALQSESAASIEAHIGAIQKVTRLLLGCDKPVVGAVHGFAVGGGFEWLLNCDLVVAADDLVAFFPEMEWGQFPTGGVTHLLPQAVGYARAMELLLLGERQSAERLERLGLVNFVVDPDQLLDKAQAVAAVIASKSRFSVASLKRLINLDLDDRLWRAVAAEEATTVQTFSQPDAGARVARFGHPKKRH